MRDFRCISFLAAPETASMLGDDRTILADHDALGLSVHLHRATKRLGEGWMTSVSTPRLASQHTAGFFRRVSLRGHGFSLGTARERPEGFRLLCVLSA
jgi:hypothetical protein